MDAASVARRTLASLEERLQRLDLVMHGDTEPELDSDAKKAQSQPIATRLNSLSKALDTFARQSKDVQDLLSLNARQVSASLTSEVTSTDEKVAAAIVLSHAGRYNLVASQLRSIQDVPVDDTSVCVDAISQELRIVNAAKRAEQQRLEVAQLREQSARVVERWHSVGVMSLQEALGEWEDRLMAAERTVRQGLARRKREEAV